MLRDKDVLPSTMRDNTRQVLEQAGVVFGKPVSGNGRKRKRKRTLSGKPYIRATLPDGWSVIKVSPVQYDVVDEQGRVRASCLDGQHRVCMAAMPRFGTVRDYGRGGFAVLVTDGNRVIHETARHPYPNGYPQSPQVDAAVGEAEDWLDAHYPGWRDASNHW